MLKTLCLALALAGPAHAAVIGVVDGSDGSHIDLYSEAEHCIGNGHKAEYVGPDQKERVIGCWTVQGGGKVSVAFLDGDVALIPFQAIREPKGA